MKAVLLIMITSALAGSASAAVEIVDFFSDFTSSDITISSSQELKGKAVFELLYEGNPVESHEVSIEAKAGQQVSKVIVWRKQPQHDYYTAKVSIFNDSELLASRTYQVSYGTAALPSFYVVDFSPTNSGVQLLLRPFNPSAADIKIELLDANDIIFIRTIEDVPLTLTSDPEVKFTWPFLLTSNKKYTARAKIYSHRLYASPLINTYISNFTATEDVEILPDDVQVDEYGASVTLRGQSQVPFDGGIVVVAKNKATGSTQTFYQRMEEILVSGKEDTVGVVWKGLAPGIYDVEIQAVDHENVTFDKYETVLRMPEYANITQTPAAKSTPGLTALISILMILAASRRLKGV